MDCKLLLKNHNIFSFPLRAVPFLRWISRLWWKTWWILTLLWWRKMRWHSGHWKSNHWSCVSRTRPKTFSKSILLFVFPKLTVHLLSFCLWFSNKLFSIYYPSVCRPCRIIDLESYCLIGYKNLTCNACIASMHTAYPAPSMNAMFVHLINSESLNAKMFLAFPTAFTNDITLKHIRCCWSGILH